jgi:5-methylcytosine-specific restriction protein A
MGRLISLAPMVASLAPLLTTQRDESGHSAVSEPWRAWYSLKAWKVLRIRVFKRDRFRCQNQDCGRVDGNTSRLVADHKTPHRGNPDLFWDEDNIQTLCKPCHDTVKQAEERRARR